MSGIPPQLLSDLRNLLENCAQFENNQRLRTLFTDERLSPWRNNLPESETFSGRVDSVISYLHDKKHRDGSNALFLLLVVLSESIDPNDSRQSELKTLSRKVLKALGSGGRHGVFLEAQEVDERNSVHPVNKVTPPASEIQNPSSTKTNTKDHATAGEKKDFFISYNKNDQKWAEWVAWQLENAGYTVVIQAWDFRPGGNFVADMQNAIVNSDRTIAILSPDYLTSRFTQPEWNAAFALDPTGEKGLLLPVLVRTCELKGLLPQIVYIDLVGLAAEDAVKTLLASMERGRVKPTVSPGFPGTQAPALPT